MAKRTVRVPNISCDHCANTIKRELRELDGISLVEVNPTTKELSVEWGAPASWEDVRRVLHEINYPPEETS
ncbi:MAG TPA: heavy metal-associated domain-containing protein [Acidobacteriota bacterium]|nr:heavy metal-associated domain-containing protein [Acidobacteriota bacterium]